MAQDGCPPSSLLHHYLDQSLDPEPGDTIAVHVATCPHCRQVLEDAGDRDETERWRQLWNMRGELPYVRGDETAVLDRAVADDFPPVAVVVEGFEILGVLGRGGLGIVYKARQVKLDRPVALKMLSAGSHASRRSIARLRAESATIARFRHPQIVTIHDVGEHQGTPYLCLEYLEGGSLADRLGGKPVPAMQAARLTAALARVVQHAHDRGIIHRDLKPANVLLAAAPDAPLEPGILKLTDFGLAKRLDAEESAASMSSGMIMGTPSYMAPELATACATAAAPPVDVYGLGAILYEMLTGGPPFRGDTPVETVFQAVSRPPVPPSRLNDQVPRTLEAICLKCLQKDPAKRYASARELANALEPFVSGWPAVKRRRWVEAGRRITRTSKFVAALLGIVVVASLWVVAARSHERTIRVESVPRHVLRLTSVPSACLHRGDTYLEQGRIELAPPIEALGMRTKTIRFDLRDDRHEQFLLNSATSNARIWEEPHYGVRYWGPIDHTEWFEVVYKLDVGFPIGAASLLATLNLCEPDSQGILDVSVDPRHGWITLAKLSLESLGDQRIDVSEIVRGSSLVYVRARMKGRDDRDGSALVQFLRTSTLADGHLDLKTPHVFELRAYDRAVPIATAAVQFNGCRSEQLWISEDGSFDVKRKFSEPGKYTGTITALAAKIPSLSRTFEVWVNSSGWDLDVSPTRNQFGDGEPFQAHGRLVAVGLGRLSGAVDFGDGSGEQELAVEPDGSFRLHHLYRAPSKYFPRVTIRDEAGHMATGYPICSSGVCSSGVRPSSN